MKYRVYLIVEEAVIDEESGDTHDWEELIDEARELKEFDTLKDAAIFRDKIEDLVQGEDLK